MFNGINLIHGFTDPVSVWLWSQIIPEWEMIMPLEGKKIFINFSPKKLHVQGASPVRSSSGQLDHSVLLRWHKGGQVNEDVGEASFGSQEDGRLALFISQLKDRRGTYWVIKRQRSSDSVSTARWSGPFPSVSFPSSHSTLTSTRYFTVSTGWSRIRRAISNKLPPESFPLRLPIPSIVATTSTTQPRWQISLPPLPPPSLLIN